MAMSCAAVSTLFFDVSAADMQSVRPSERF
jgi:hypothetical protein